MDRHYHPSPPLQGLRFNLFLKKKKKKKSFEEYIILLIKIGELLLFVHLLY